MSGITFQIERSPETGGYVARWNDAPEAGGITTQGETLDELQRMKPAPCAASSDKPQ